jgi:hypothetical protein
LSAAEICTPGDAPDVGRRSGDIDHNTRCSQMCSGYFSQGHREITNRLRHFTRIEVEKHIPYAHKFSPSVCARLTLSEVKSEHIDSASGENWFRENAPDDLNSSRCQRIRVQSDMCPSAIVIPHIRKVHVAVLIGTKRMVGRIAASAIAWLSRFSGV